MSQLQTWMKANAETDETLSQKLGVSRVQVRRLRLGENKPSAKTAINLQKVTGIPAPVWIFGPDVAA